MDILHIVKIRTSPQNREDFFTWAPEKNGCSSVRSAYKLASSTHEETFIDGASTSHPDGSRPMWRAVWSSAVPPKMKVFAWKKAISSALPTNQ